MTAHPTALRLRPPRPRRRGVLVLGVVAVLLLLVLPSLVTLGAEWPWFQALGYERVFATRLVDQGAPRCGGRRRGVRLPLFQPAVRRAWRRSRPGGPSVGLGPALRVEACWAASSCTR